MKLSMWLSAALVLGAGSVRAQLAQPPAGVAEGLVKDVMDACPANPELPEIRSAY